MTVGRMIRAAMVGACVAAATLSAGCNIVGPIIYFAHGESDIPAVYKLPPDKAAVIFVDDRESKVTSRQTRALIGETAEREMLTNGASKDMIQCRNALQAAMRERYGKPLTIVEIGKAVKAQIVIYATIDTFTLSGDNSTYSPLANLRIKVIDVETEKRIFPGPDDPVEWYPLKVDIGGQAAETPSSVSDMMQAEQSLAKRAGTALGRLFYAHQPPMDPRRLNDAGK
ncbi:MAG: hypothetical protein ACREJO_00240 [Phycisphaerales bacterium]